MMSPTLSSMQTMGVVGNSYVEQLENTLCPSQFAVIVSLSLVQMRWYIYSC